MDLAYGLRGVIPDGATFAWGARAIHRPGLGGFELLPDRQAHKGSYPSCVYWLNTSALPSARKIMATVRGGDQTVHGIDQGHFHMRFSASGSHGYVYISAWAA